MQPVEIECNQRRSSHFRDLLDSSSSSKRRVKSLRRRNLASSGEWQVQQPVKLPITVEQVKNMTFRDRG